MKMNNRGMDLPNWVMIFLLILVISMIGFLIIFSNLIAESNKELCSQVNGKYIKEPIQSCVSIVNGSLKYWEIESDENVFCPLNYKPTLKEVDG